MFFQSIVTVVAQKVTLGEQNGHDTFERDFYFTVSSGPLTFFDKDPPDCGSASVVCNARRECLGTTWRRERDVGSAKEIFWRALNDTHFKISLPTPRTPIQRLQRDLLERRGESTRPRNGAEARHSRRRGRACNLRGRLRGAPRHRHHQGGHRGRGGELL